ncbi:hypothetical protein SNEBB_007907 [Seison nebaliae]|nr:hypothetical protein SNEBB_007907 [Seison nebaliae]
MINIMQLHTEQSTSNGNESHRRHSQSSGDTEEKSSNHSSDDGGLINENFLDDRKNEKTELMDGMSEYSGTKNGSITSEDSSTNDQQFDNGHNGTLSSKKKGDVMSMNSDQEYSEKTNFYPSDSDSSSFRSSPFSTIKTSKRDEIRALRTHYKIKNQMRNSPRIKHDSDSIDPIPAVTKEKNNFQDLDIPAYSLNIDDYSIENVNETYECLKSKQRSSFGEKRLSPYFDFHNRTNSQLSTTSTLLAPTKISESLKLSNQPTFELSVTTSNCQSNMSKPISSLTNSAIKSTSLSSLTSSTSSLCTQPNSFQTNHPHLKSDTKCLLKSASMISNTNNNRSRINKKSSSTSSTTTTATTTTMGNNVKRGNNPKLMNRNYGRSEKLEKRRLTNEKIESRKMTKHKTNETTNNITSRTNKNKTTSNSPIRSFNNHRSSTLTKHGKQASFAVMKQSSTPPVLIANKENSNSNNCGNIVRKEDILSYIECPLCQTTLSDPRNLMCGHTVCLKCVDALRRSSSNKFHLCPVCNKSVYIDRPDVLPINFLVQKILSIPYHHIGLSNINCEECKDSENAACTECRHCNRRLCLNCKVKHLEEIRESIEEEISTNINKLDTLTNELTNNLENGERMLLSQIKHLHELVEEKKEFIMNHFKQIRHQNMEQIDLAKQKVDELHLIDKLNEAKANEEKFVDIRRDLYQHNSIINGNLSSLNSSNKRVEQMTKQFHSNIEQWMDLINNSPLEKVERELIPLQFQPKRICRSSKYIYISTTRTVNVFDLKYQHLYWIGDQGKERGRFLSCGSIDINGNDQLVAVDHVQNKIFIFNENDDLIKTINQRNDRHVLFRQIQQMKVDQQSNNIFILDKDRNSLRRLNSDGDQLFQIVMDHNELVKSFDVKKETICLITSRSIHLYDIDGVEKRCIEFKSLKLCQKPKQVYLIANDSLNLLCIFDGDKQFICFDSFASNSSFSMRMIPTANFIDGIKSTTILSVYQDSLYITDFSKKQFHHIRNFAHLFST